MASVRVQPRPTPAERAEVPVEIDVDAELADFATTISDWVDMRSSWMALMREGHDFGRVNNVELVLDFASGEALSSVSFRLDQISRVDDAGEELVLRLEDWDGIAKLLRLRPNGLAVELFHVLTVT